MFDNRGAYDKTAAMWSPQGELNQLDYARIASQRGSSTVAVVLEGKTVVIGGEQYQDPLIVRPQKINEVDDDLYLVASGLSTDATILLNQARIIAQNHKLIYGEKISVRSLAMRLGDIMARHTLAGGLRPFGCSLLIAGYYDALDVANLYFVDNGGTFFETRAYASGKGAPKAIEFLRKEYRPNMSLKEAVDFVIETIKVATDKEELSRDNVELRVIPTRLQSEIE